MKKSKEKEAKAAERKAVLDEIFGRDEASKSPAVLELVAELKATQKRPNALELATIAALMRPEMNGDGANVAAAEQARALLTGCQTVLRREIGDEINHTQVMEELDAEGPPDFTDWEWALHNETFPLAFERALELIVGKKVRRTNRLKAFADFTGEMFELTTGSSAKGVATLVEQKIAKLTADGFRPESFERAGRLFTEWRKTRKSEVSRDAAKKRWSKRRH